jgi:hypothetical protein
MCGTFLASIEKIKCHAADSLSYFGLKREKCEINNLTRLENEKVLLRTTTTTTTTTAKSRSTP